MGTNFPASAHGKNNQRPTQHDVAELAGVSVSTVSRALRQGSAHGPVKEGTRRRALAAAEQLSYRLPERRHIITIGVILPNLADAFFSELAQHLIAQLHASSCRVILAVMTAQEAVESQDEADCIRTLLDQQLDGIIAVPAGSTSGQVWQRVLTGPLPMVVIDPNGLNSEASPQSAPKVDTFTFDDTAGVKAAVHHLRANGHIRIGMLVGPIGAAAMKMHLKAFSSAFREGQLGDPPRELIQECTADISSREEAARRLLRLSQPPTAIIAASSLLCEALITELRSQQLSIPRDMSVIAIGDANWMHFFTPQLTAVVRPVEVLAITATDRLMRLLQYKTSKKRIDDPPKTVVPPRPPQTIVQTSMLRLANSIADQHHLPDYDAVYLKRRNALYAAEEAQDSHRVANELRWLAEIELKRADYARATEHLERGWTLVQVLDAPWRPELETMYLATWGKLAGNRGQYTDAEEYFRRGLKLANESGLTHLMCDFYMHLGKLAGNLGKYEDAKVHLLKGLTAAKDLQSKALTSGFLMHLGWVLGNQGIYDEAQDCLRQGLRLVAGYRPSASTGNISSAELESGLRMNLGWILQCEGDYEGALEELELGLKRAQEITHRVRICGLRENLSIVAWCRGEFSQALSHAREGLKEARIAQHPARTCGLLEALSWALINQEYFAEKNFLEARARLEEGLELVAKLTYPVRHCGLLQTRGWLHIKQGREQEALSDLMGALVRARQIGHRFLMSSTLLGIGELRLKQEQWKKAEASFKAALAYARRGRPQRALEGRSLEGLARAAANQGNTRSARGYKQESCHILDDIGYHAVG